MTVRVDPYEFGVLQKDHHERLVADLDGYAKDAGILPHWIFQGLPDNVSSVERAYLKSFRRNTDEGVFGLVMTGDNSKGIVETRMAAMAGALVRNFIRARVMTLGSVLDLLPRQEMPNLSALLIPNFFLSQANGGTVAPWQVNALFDYLVYRQVTGLQTVIYASDLSLLGKEYGLAFKSHVEVHFKKSSVQGV
jgi:hypothetical protein